MQEQSQQTNLLIKQREEELAMLISKSGIKEDTEMELELQLMLKDKIIMIQGL